jgi:hypothetical protein
MDLNFNQDTKLTAQIRRGNKVVIGTVWINADNSPKNLTGYSIKAVVREQNSSPILATLTETVSTNGFTQKDALIGKATVTLLSALTKTLIKEKYDLELGLFDSSNELEKSLFFTLEVERGLF